MRKKFEENIDFFSFHKSRQCEQQDSEKLNLTNRFVPADEMIIIMSIIFSWRLNTV